MWLDLDVGALFVAAYAESESISRTSRDLCRRWAAGLQLVSHEMMEVIYDYAERRPVICVRSDACALRSHARASV